MLFDDFERTDDRGTRVSEARFEFLNRSSWPPAARERALLEDWYSRFPDRDGALRAQIRARDQNHRAAAFELLLYEVLRISGLSVDPYPEAPGGSRPDFFVRSPSGRSVYVEATVVGGDPFSHPKLEAEGFEAIHDLVSRTPAGIGLWLDVRGTLRKSPKLSKLTREVCQWLNTLDPKQVAACGPGEWPRTEIPVGAAYGDWVLELCAVRHHGTGLIQKWPGRGRSGTIGKELRRAIRKKAAQHRGIDAPLVVAVNDAGASGRTFEVAALYGPQKIAFPTGDDLPRGGPGIWLYGNPANATNTSISGVLLFRGAFALYAPEAVQACFYLNSYVEDLVPEELRVSAMRMPPDGELRFHDGWTVGDVLGISEASQGPNLPSTSGWRNRRRRYDRAGGHHPAVAQHTRGTRAGMIAIPPSARRFLADRAYGHLVTRNPDGSPQTSMLWFDVEGDELLCNTVDGRVKVRNMRHDPRVIVSVQDHDNALSYLLVHGRVTAMTPDGAREHIEKLGQRFTAPGEQQLLAQFRVADAPRLLVRIAAERLGGRGPWLAEQGGTTE